MRRLNKYITDAGYCSRREADRYIEQGRVTINGHEAELGDMVGDEDLVEVDGERVGHKNKHTVYIVCNKPVGVTCTTEERDKTNIIDFLGYKERIFPVGRLDKDSEGLIILTNDGDIVNKILRAGNNNPKEYIVTVDKPITTEFLKRMGEGVNILGVKTKPCDIFRRNDTTFIIHLTQGLNRQIRRMCQTLGYKVVRLKRLKVMNITLGNLEPGRWRYLTPQETAEMHAILATSSGTEEASNEKQVKPAKAFKGRPHSSSAAYRKEERPDRNAGRGSKGGSVRTTGAKPSAESEYAADDRPRRTSKPRAGKPQGSFAQYRKRGKTGEGSKGGTHKP